MAAGFADLMDLRILRSYQFLRQNLVNLQEPLLTCLLEKYSLDRYSFELKAEECTRHPLCLATHRFLDRPKERRQMFQVYKQDRSNAFLPM